MGKALTGWCLAPVVEALMALRGRLKVKGCTAIARELAGFIWAIACEIKTQQSAVSA